MADGTPPKLDYRSALAARPWHRRAVVWGLLAAGIASVAILASRWRKPSPNLRASSDLAECSMEEHQIKLAIELYQQDHGGHYPDSLAALVSATGLGPEVLICPASTGVAAALPPPRSGTDRPTTQQVAAALAAPGHVSYIYCGHADWTNATVPGDAVVIYEPPSDHGGTGSNIVFGDGHGDFIPMPRAARLIAAAAATTRPVSAASVP